MNAIQLLRQMHADAKVQLKTILATPDPAEALRLWQALQPVLDVHEQLEDRFVYTPIADESGPGTPLGDWDARHEADVAVAKQLIAAVDKLDSKSPEWRTAVGRVADVLARHVMDEEGQIFGRIEQVWGTERLERVGAEMQKAMPRASAKTPARAAR